MRRKRQLKLLPTLAYYLPCLYFLLVDEMAYTPKYNCHHNTITGFCAERNRSLLINRGMISLWKARLGIFLLSLPMRYRRRIRSAIQVRLHTFDSSSGGPCRDLCTRPPAVSIAIRVSAAGFVSWNQDSSTTEFKPFQPSCKHDDDTRVMPDATQHCGPNKQEPKSS
jgi:hypothetical protein